MSQPQQEWEPVIWTKSKSEKPNRPTQSRLSKKMSKLDSDEPLPPEKSTLELRLKIIQARNIKKLSQKQLAEKLNVQTNLINNYENGKEKPTHKHMQKLSKILGIILR